MFDFFFKGGLALRISEDHMFVLGQGDMTDDFLFEFHAHDRDWVSSVAVV